MSTSRAHNPDADIKPRSTVLCVRSYM